ncbi:MAG: nucleotidyltransferase family protein [Chloroflexi bacterium]|nr:nucleotidyltransferase family protein [Chloroflexota bacterium]
MTTAKKNVKSLPEIKEILARHKAELMEKYSVSRIGIFGSYVRGEQRKRSDVDILVEFAETPGFFKFLDLEEYLKGLLGVKVDLVMKDALKPYIGERILQEVNYL